MEQKKFSANFQGDAPAGNLKTLETWKPENFENIKNDTWDMLNNFCFHVHAYAPKWLFIVENR